MNLAIDVGNSKVKFGIFGVGGLLKTSAVAIFDFNKEIAKLLDLYPTIDHIILSTVGVVVSSYLEKLPEDYKILSLTSGTKIPFNNSYGTPNTLGVDRIALAAAAVKLYAGKNCLIIDAGTCVTYDFIDENANYTGGAISPGINLRYKSLNDYTAKLPLLSPEIPDNFIGTNTVESIHTGVVMGIVSEIDGMIDRYKKQFTDLTVILTGGDGKFLSNQLKNSIFANSNFLLEGLNHILEYNSH